MTVRRAMTPARMERIWSARGGLCGNCGEPVPMRGADVVYDHRFVLWITGDDSDDAIWPLHKACDQVKTPKDLKVIGHIRRIIKKSNPETRPKPKMRGGRSFPKVKTMWPKRKFGR